MDNKRFDYVSFAREFVCGYFQTLNATEKINATGFNELFEICNNDIVLLEHLKALVSIFNKAIEKLEKVSNNETK